MRFLLFIGLLLTVATGCGQEPQWRYLAQTDTLRLPLGDTQLTLLRTRYGDQPFPFLLHLHHNEASADSSMHAYLARYGGMALSLQNNRQRLVSFPLGGRRFLFDPNRMFTDSGTISSLKLLSRPAPAAVSAIRRFSEQLVRLIPEGSAVVAVHNNTADNYSLHSYLPQGAYANEVQEIFRNPEMDPDDFVLTTDPVLFQRIKEKGISVVLQNNEQAQDDGSFSHFAAKHAMVYLNVEAEHGHFDQQLRMLEQVIAAIAR